MTNIKNGAEEMSMTSGTGVGADIDMMRYKIDQTPIGPETHKAHHPKYS